MSDEKIYGNETITFQPNIDYKPIISLSENFKVYTKTKYNWFQKKMIKLFFGFEVVDYEC